MLPYPKIIEIQTHNICNADCSICPYSAYKSKNPSHKMDTVLFDKILYDLKENEDHIETIIPYLNNEPFLDKHFISNLEKIRTMFPNKTIEVSTNLSAFSEEKFQYIFSNNLIDDFRVSFFGGTPETYAMLMPKLSFKRNIQYLKRTLDMKDILASQIQLSIIMVLLPLMDIKKETDSLKEELEREELPIRFFGYLDRAGSNVIKNIKPYKESSYRMKGCSLRRNEERFCINVKGDVVLCSQDWFAQVNLGNVEKNSIIEIWTGYQKQKIDNYIGGCEDVPSDFLCRDCKLAYFEVDGERVLNFSGDKYMDSSDRKKLNGII